MKLKRICGMLLVMILCWTAAYADTNAVQVYDAVVDLLTETTNVTLNGNATFSLDGKQFKYVDTSYVQDGLNSKWVLDLTSTRADGRMKKSGFTVIANNRYKYAIEVFDPSECKIVECDPQSVILRSSVALTQLISLGRALVEQIPEWSEKEFSRKDDGSMSIHVSKEQIPGAVNHLLSLGVLMAVQRTMNIVDDSIMTPVYPLEVATFEDSAVSTTPTRAIISNTEEYELTDLSAEIKMDKNGRLTDVSGTARFVLHTFQDGEHELEITFEGKTFDYGNSTVPAFDPAEYGFDPKDGRFYIPGNQENVDNGPGWG